MFIYILAGVIFVVITQRVVYTHLDTYTLIQTYTMGGSLSLWNIKSDTTYIAR